MTEVVLRLNTDEVEVLCACVEHVLADPEAASIAEHAGTTVADLSTLLLHLGTRRAHAHHHR